MNRNSQRGVALITTLIMLSVVVLMAVAFLAVSRRERASVSVSADQADARFMADTALARAQAELAARMLASLELLTRRSSNLPPTAAGLQTDLIVSTNFINAGGFRPSGIYESNNVSYVYQNGNPLNNALDIQRNSANLYFDPRPPVYVPTSLRSGAPLDFRFYLDFNRNGRFETNGFLPVTDREGRPIQGQQGGFANFAGDPEWIGVLQRPDYPHSGSNLFVGRYAFIVVPAGKTLDLNFIHNQSKRLDPFSDGFYRDQGVGSWELNLAAFLRDLNTNIWFPATYAYNPNVNQRSLGVAFDDASSILQYRYFNSYKNLASVSLQYGPNGRNAFINDPIDRYADGRRQNQDPTLPWSGSDTTNAFFDAQELFADKGNDFENYRLFVRRLTNSAFNDLSSYNRYTFYRMLGQMGVDSFPATREKMNLNYTNTPASASLTLKESSMGGSTNFAAWRPVDFFTNAAQLLLKAHLGTLGLTNVAPEFGINHIQVYPFTPLTPTNYFTHSVHRLLQLAANIYDATTNRTFPSVFRPIFSTVGEKVFITQWAEEVDANSLNRQFFDLNRGINGNVNVHGIPLIIGAKKGFPNFNEFSSHTFIQVTRKLEMVKNTPKDTLPTLTNQMYIIGISNLVGLEAWNSYTSTYPRQIVLHATNQISIALKNGNLPASKVLYPVSNVPLVTTFSSNISVTVWAGRDFKLPLITNQIFLQDSAFRFNTTPQFQPANVNGSPGLPFEKNTGNFPTPQWTLLITNRLQYYAVDAAANRIIDYVSFTNLTTQIDVTHALTGQPNDIYGKFWSTNRVAGKGAPQGISYQIQVALGLDQSADWVSYQGIDDKQKAIDEFRDYLGLPPIKYPKEVLTGHNSAAHQVPFSPSRKIHLDQKWQADDPLVHYTLADLTDPTRQPAIEALQPAMRSYTNSNLGVLNERYAPWGGNPNLSSADQNAYKIAIKDPMVRFSDDWDFPTNKFPSIGYLGRVHRGTAWQTVYMKPQLDAPALGLQNWFQLRGDIYTYPTNDWRIFDLFTVAPNANAARGLLSVNQTNLAAWSAVLSGVSVLTNVTDDSAALRSVVSNQELLVEPTSTQLQLIVQSINAARASFPEGRFPNLGSVLAATNLTVGSPFLNLSPNQMSHGISDAAYERIPLQIMSLLKEDEPRVVVYSFGQGLKPAPNSRVVTPGQYYQLCTNYQIMSETVTKTVLRYEPKLLQNPTTKLFYTNGWRTIIESFNIIPSD